MAHQNNSDQRFRRIPTRARTRRVVVDDSESAEILGGGNTPWITSHDTVGLTLFAQRLHEGDEQPQNFSAVPHPHHTDAVPTELDPPGSSEEIHGAFKPPKNYIDSPPSRTALTDSIRDDYCDNLRLSLYSRTCMYRLPRHIRESPYDSLKDVRVSGVTMTHFFWLSAATHAVYLSSLSSWSTRVPWAYSSRRVDRCMVNALRWSAFGYDEPYRTSTSFYWYT